MVRHRWGPVLVAGLAGLVVLVLWWLFTRDLFVFSEARGFALYRPPIDPVRFLVLPRLDWGAGRLSAQLVYQATGRACGIDASCFAAVGAGISAIAVVALILHTRQITGSLGLALVAGGLWITSPALVGVSVWQATWFDPLAFILSVALSSLWWEVLGRERLGRLAIGLFVVGSVALLAFAFNAKETAYALIVVLPVVAVLRGVRMGGAVRRNLLMAAVPIAYAAWFIAHGLTHIDQAYAAKSAHQSIIDGLPGLLRSILGLEHFFMYVEQRGTEIEALVAAAWVGYVVVGGMIAALVAAAGWRHLRARRVPVSAVPAGPSGSVADDRTSGQPLRGRAIDGLKAYPVELYLACVIVATVAILAPAKIPTAYYLPIPTWASIVLLLLVVRRLTAPLRRGTRVAAIVVGAWALTHVLVLASLIAPGSTFQQLHAASGRIREVGETLRTILADRAGGPIAWRTIGVPATDFYLLRDPGAPHVSDDEADLVGQDLMPYLLQDEFWRRLVTPLRSGTVDELRSGMPGLSEERQLVVVIDADYHLLLVLYEGDVVFDAGDDAP